MYEIDKADRTEEFSVGLKNMVFFKKNNEITMITCSRIFSFG